MCGGFPFSFLSLCSKNPLSICRLFCLFTMNANVCCYEQVCLAEMFKFSTKLYDKLAYSTCYVPFLFTNLI